MIPERAQPETECRITIATEADMNVIMHLQDIWKDDVGRLRRSAHGEHVAAGDTFLIHHNGQEAGYLLAHCGEDARTTIKQVAVHPDLLRTTLGTTLMRRIERRAIGKGQLTISLRTRTDLPANLFWPTVGYYYAGQAASRNQRRSLVNTWVRPLTSPVYVPESVRRWKAGPPRRNRRPL